MLQLYRRSIGSLATIAALSLLAPGARAQGATPTRLRGTIVSLEGNVLTVATRDGSRAAVTLAEPTTIVSLRRVALAEITPGTSVGAVAEPGPDGELRAVALTVLPPGARITEQQFAWDTSDTASMNNGPVAAIVETNAGGDLTLSINGRSVVIRIAADTPMLMPVPAARDDLVAGAVVFIIATRAADGALGANRVTVGKGGVAPVI